MRFTPSPHSDRDSLLDERALSATRAQALDSREGLHVIDGGRRATRAVTGDDMARADAERDLYRHLRLVPRDAPACSGASCRQGREPCRDGCLPEMACAAPSSPSVPTRRVRRLPTVSVWRRLWLWVFPAGRVW